jgi:hypothetical protein
MRTSVFVAFLLFVMHPLFAGDAPVSGDGNYLSILDIPQEKQPKEMQELSASAVPSRKVATDLAWGSWRMREGGIRAYESVRVVGLYHAAVLGGIGIDGFAAPGDWVWELHVGSLGGIEGVIFIDAKTKQIHVFPDKNSPAKPPSPKPAPASP